MKCIVLTLMGALALSSCRTGEITPPSLPFKVTIDVTP